MEECRIELETEEGEELEDINLATQDAAQNAKLVKNHNNIAKKVYLDRF